MMYAVVMAPGWWSGRTLDPPVVSTHPTPQTAHDAARSHGRAVVVIHTSTRAVVDPDGRPLRYYGERS